MWFHLSSVLKISNPNVSEMKVVVTQMTITNLFSEAKPYSVGSPQQRERVEAFVRLIVSDMRPVLSVQSANFKSFCKLLDPKFHIPCEKKL